MLNTDSLVRAPDALRLHREAIWRPNIHQTFGKAQDEPLGPLFGLWMFREKPSWVSSDPEASERTGTSGA